MHGVLSEMLSDDFVYDALSALNKEFSLNSKENKYHI